MKKAKHTGKEITIVGVVEEYEEDDQTGLIITTDDDETTWWNSTNRVKGFLKRSAWMLKRPDS